MEQLSAEECQAIIDYAHIWNVVDLTKRDGSKIKFKQADFAMWSNQYPHILKECVMKYDVGDFCSEHKDNPWAMINPNYHARAVWITPLNTGYEGGDLYFDGKLIEQVVGIPIKQMRTTPHEITEVTSGIRYSLVSWYFVSNKIIFDV